MLEKIIMLVIKAVPKGKYEKLNMGYNFEPEEGNYLITATHGALEFRIKTIKWIPGSYEPIESSEIYTSIDYKAFEALSEKERLNYITVIINELERK